MGSTQAALTYAQTQTQTPSQNWLDKCLQFVNNAWGNSVSWLGAPTAMQSWMEAPNKHTDTSIPPAGAAVYWGTSNPAGHVALSAGNGYVYTTDFCSAGKVCKVPISQVTQGWGATYLGWSSPTDAAGTPSNVTDSLGGSIGQAAAKWTAKEAGKNFFGSMPPNFGIRLLWFVVGLVLVILALVILFRRPVSGVINALD